MAKYWIWTPFCVIGFDQINRRVGIAADTFFMASVDLLGNFPFFYMGRRDFITGSIGWGKGGLN